MYVVFEVRGLPQLVAQWFEPETGDRIQYAPHYRLCRVLPADGSAPGPWLAVEQS